MRRWFSPWFVLAVLILCSNLVSAQSVTTGAVAGEVTDPTGALIQNASIEAISVDTGVATSTTSNNVGFYRLSFLAPGSYRLKVTAKGFRTKSEEVQVHVGQIATFDFALAVSGGEVGVSVEAQDPMLQTENSNIATTVGQIPTQDLPNPGNDLTYVVQNAPGVVMNTQQGLGNFSTFGLPATSNVFVVNGMQNNNSFLNTANSGATNLVLGLGEVQELTVINNPYSGEYGTLAGSQVNVITKSGTNQWHGDAKYWWNGSVLNANDWFNKYTAAGNPVTPRSFDNANQWSASIGGPIQKDRTFFYVYTEGLRVIIPTSQSVLLPSPEFQASTIANLNGLGLTDSASFYQNVMFPLYNNAPGAAAAVPVPFTPGSNGGCNGFTFPNTGGPTAIGAPGGPSCALQFQSTINNLNTEWILSARLDHNFSNDDRLFARFRTDHGTQATFTDVLNPLFNVVGHAPQYEGQLNETHFFSGNATNTFVMSASWYGYTQSNPNRTAALALFPTTLLLGDGTLSTLGGENYLFPQGRNATQYGFVDDVTILRNKDTFKFGTNYQRYDITDLDFPILSSGVVTAFSINDFFNGGINPVNPLQPGALLVQNFFTRASQPIAFYRLGFYAQDEHRFTNNFKANISLRVDHNSVPVCQTNCFGHLAANFSDLNPDPTIPYNQLAPTGLHQVFPSGDTLLWQPRAGFAWQPFGRSDFVIRGGAGVFTDSLPGAAADRIGANPPLVNSFSFQGLPLAPTETNPLYGGNLFAFVGCANATFVAGYNGGASFADFQNPGSPFFSPCFIAPNVTNPPRHLRTPRYYEWSFDIQKGIGNNTVFKASYVGNHGIYGIVQNTGINGFCANPFPGCFPGLPAAPPDPRFGTIDQFENSGSSHYNGFTLSMQRRFSRGLYLQANYTWSHALDDVSNGGFLNFNFATNTSVLNPENPASVRQFNYGNSDYDVRHYLNVSYVYQSAFKHPLLRDWEISGLVFARSGLPFTVTDSLTSNILNFQNYGSPVVPGVVFAGMVGSPSTTCSGSAAGLVSTPCLNASDFMSPLGVGFSTQRRNQFSGPGFFDTDFSVNRSLRLPRTERGRFTAGVQFFNLFNHPNFDQPIANIADPRFGHIIRTVSSPTTVLGSFLGGDGSPRMIRLSAKISF